MSITVINMTNAPINSATMIAGLNHSVHNEISPGHYYIHDTVAGSIYQLRNRWWIGNAEYEQNIRAIIMLSLGVPLTAIGVALTVVGAMPIAAAITAGEAVTAGSIAMTAIGAAATAVSTTTGVAEWVIQAVDVGKEDDVTESTIHGAENKIFMITGKIEFKETKDSKGRITKLTSKHPNEYPLKATKVSRSAFDDMVANGEIVQSRMPLVADMARLLNTNGGIEPHRIGRRHVEWGKDILVQANRRYWIENYHPEHSRSILAVHDSEDNGTIYRVPFNEQSKLPEAQWQLIPVGFDRNVEASARKPVFILCERRYGKVMVAEGSNKVSMWHPRDERLKDCYLDFTGEQWVSQNGDAGTFCCPLSTGEDPWIFDTESGHTRLRTKEEIDWRIRYEWTPFFALIPSRMYSLPDRLLPPMLSDVVARPTDVDKHFLITPIWNAHPNEEFWEKPTSEKGRTPFHWFLSGRDDDGVTTYAYRGRNPESFDQWKLTEVPASKG